VVSPSPLADGDLWISVGDKVFHSSDSGVSFVELAGLHKVNNIGFGKPAAGKTTPTIYLNGKIGGIEAILRSEDAGQSWVRIDDAEHQFGWKNDVIGDARVSERVYLATGGRGILYGDPMQ
jgi:xyloglucan-specific exo-beta-1,4-glucanase